MIERSGMNQKVKVSTPMCPGLFSASLTCLYQIIEAAVRGWVRFVQIGKDSESNLWFGIQGYENIDLAPRLIGKARLVLVPYLPGDLIDNTFQ